MLRPRDRMHELCCLVLQKSQSPPCIWTDDLQGIQESRLVPTVKGGEGSQPLLVAGCWSFPCRKSLCTPFLSVVPKTLPLCGQFLALGFENFLLEVDAGPLVSSDRSCLLYFCSKE